MALDPERQLPEGVESVNEAYFDSLVRHQISLLRLSKREAREINKVLDASEKEMVRLINKFAGKSTGLETPADIKRMQTLVKALSATRLQSWAEVRPEWVAQLRKLAVAQAELQDKALKTAVPVTLETTLPSSALLASLATRGTYAGKNFQQWFRSLTSSDLQRISSAVRNGMVQGLSAREISQSVVGTKAAKGTDGVTQTTRNNVDTVVRTMISGVSNAANRAYYLANKDIFKFEVYVAVLDSRTTPICRSLDGRKFPIGKGPYPPLHPNCRSLRVAVIDGEVIGNRPAKPVTQRMLLRQYAKKEGIKVPSSRDALPRGHKGTFDTFARGRLRELTGQVPAKVDYQQWLTRQTAEFQDDVLGPTRGKLFRKGGLTLDKFVNRAGDEINLEQLAVKQRQAFLDAGLDPEDF